MQFVFRMRTPKDINMHLGVPYLLPIIAYQSEVSGLKYFVLPLKRDTVYRLKNQQQWIAVKKQSFKEVYYYISPCF